ncbi:MAG: AAA family ATPase [Nitriliruptorales bacterium]|nr:AAA family ATPase [Nitriliruptorales bacterium]
MNRIILTTDDAAFEQRVRDAFQPSLNGDLRRVDYMTAQSLEDLVGEKGSATEVVALGPGIDIDIALNLAQRFDIERPEISVLLVAPGSPGLLERALRAGVRDVLAPDADAVELVRMFDRAADVAQRRRSALGPDVVADSPTGKVITVVSPKGGSGKTTTCTNLALGLAALAPGEVVLVDLDLQFGDVASALQLDPEATMADVARASSVDPAAVKVALTSHQMGLFVLCAPESPAEAEEITAGQIARTLQVLADEFRYVIVDTDAGLSEHALTAIEHSTDLICVCSMDVPSVRALHKELLALEQLGLVPGRKHFLLNRADARVGLAASDIEATVQLPIDVSVPSSRAVPLSLNQGSPVIQSDPRSPVARQFMSLVKRVADEPATTRNAGFLRRRKDAR